MEQHVPHTFGYKLSITALVVLPFLGFLIAVILCWNKYVFASDLILFAVMYFFTALGVTIGYHRVLTHQGFECPSWLRGFFLICGAMAFAGSKPEHWAAVHVKHHAHSDDEDDPHSPLKGFLFAHVAWLYEDTSDADPAVYVPHLLQDPVVMFVSRYLLVWGVLSFAIPFAIGGWTGLLWGGLVRMFFLTHATWSVNSVCHTFGKRDFETTDESRNEWVVGLVAFGEGWHNNHHAFPRNAFHGMKWYQFDLSGIVIRVLEKVGLVWNVQRVSEETAEAHRVKTIATAPALADMRASLETMLKSADEKLRAFFSSGIESSVTGVENEVKRLREIQAFVAKASHLKKQKLMAYAAEVQQILARLEEAFRQRTGMMKGV